MEMSKNTDTPCFETWFIELLHLGGRFEGWNYCSGCKEKKNPGHGMLMFSSCEHSMCLPCLGSKSRNLPCPDCGKISTLRELSPELLNTIKALDKTVLESKPILDHLNMSKKKTETPLSTTRRRGRKTAPVRDKRNSKGETKLQVACIARDLAKVKALITEGADVNAQDNTGWTSLHEAAIYGSEEIARALLEAGALVDVPGEMNMTPLHDAVYNNQPKVAKLLISHGANVSARNSKGQKPIDLAATAELKSLLARLGSASAAAPPHRKKPAPPTYWSANRVLLLPAGGAKALTAQLKLFAQQFKLKTSTGYTDKVSHVVVDAEDGVCDVSFEVLQGILGGKTIVSSQWIAKCMEAGKLLDPLLFEVKGTRKFPGSSAPERARNNGESKGPGLFNGCNIFLRHATGEYAAAGLSLAKGGFAHLIKLGGGRVLSREPKADGPSGSSGGAVPYHASPRGPLAKCSDYIVCWPNDKQIQYNMPHIRTLPLAWLVESMETFKLVDGAAYFNSLA